MKHELLRAEILCMKNLSNFFIRIGALKFGTFILKSGRVSPYFFDTSVINTGKYLIKIGNCISQLILNNKISSDVLFGVAYKGIALAISTSIILNTNHNMNVGYCFNRKEYKKHGEQGNLIGHNIHNSNVVIVDDVITSGKSILHAINVVKSYDATLTGIITIFDRKECGSLRKVASSQIQSVCECPVISLMTIEDIVYHLSSVQNMQYYIEKIREYRKNTFGIM